MNPAIIYLAQNSRKDNQYQRDSRTLLARSLTLLYENYNQEFKHPVIVFHEGDFQKQDQEEIKAGRSEIHFHEIHFQIPDFLLKEEVPDTWKGFHAYGIGHRHMIRFYALQVYDILYKLGYDWYMRMDDDSFIHSKINYNLFEFMEKNGYGYGYRVDVQDGVDVSCGFGEAVLAYLTAEQIEPTFFWDYMKRYSFFQAKLDKGINTLKNVTKRFLMKQNSKKQYLLWDLPKIPHYLNKARYNRWGYYNNFHITKIEFWRQPSVQSFLNYIDRIGGGYKYRWNDLIIQAAAIQIFMPQKNVYKFKDWTYEHATIKSGKLFFGGIYQGTEDKQAQAVNSFRKNYGKTKSKQTY